MSALSPRQMFLLDEACKPIREAFGQKAWLVGTAVSPRDDRAPRDIDVRMMLHDEDYDRIATAVGTPMMAFLGLAIGEYLAARTGLPIDFQVQRMTEANEMHDGSRNPLGCRDLSEYTGDAPRSTMSPKPAPVSTQQPETMEYVGSFPQDVIDWVNGNGGRAHWDAVMRVVLIAKQNGGETIVHPGMTVVMGWWPPTFDNEGRQTGYGTLREFTVLNPFTDGAPVSTQQPETTEPEVTE